MWAVYEKPGEWLDGLRNEHQLPVSTVLGETVKRLNQNSPETRFGLYVVGSTVVRAEYREDVVGHDYGDIDVCLVGLPKKDILRVTKNRSEPGEWLWMFNEFLEMLCEGNCEGVDQRLIGAKPAYAERGDDPFMTEHYEGLDSRLFIAKLPGDANLDFIFSCQDYTHEQWKTVLAEKTPLWPYIKDFEITSVPYIPLLER